MVRVVVLLVWWLLLPCLSGATTYYVDSTPPGSPATNCTQAQNIATPHNTIAEGINCLAAGDTLYVRAGNYNERVVIDPPSGSDAAYTKILAYPGETPVIRMTTTPSPASIVDITATRHHIQFSGFKITGEAMPDLRANGLRTSIPDTGATHHILLEHLEFDQVPGDNLIVNEDSYGVTIRHCYFHDGVQASNDTSPSGGIYMQATKTGGGSHPPNVIEYNRFENTGGGHLSQRTGQGVSMYGMIVRYNDFKQLTKNSGHIFLDGNAVGADIHHNAFTGCGTGSRMMRTYNDTFTFAHNTMHGPCPDGIDRQTNQELTAAQKLRVTNNIFSHTLGTSSGTVWESGTPPVGNFLGNPSFVNATNGADLRLAAGSGAIGGASDGFNDGAFQTITRTSAAITGASLVASFSVPGGVLPLSVCDTSKFTINYGGGPITVTACTPGQPLSHQVTMTMASAPTAGQTVTMTWTYGAVEDNAAIGGTQNNKILAQATPQAVTNTAPQANWMAGASRTPPAGTNRVCLATVFYERETDVTAPLSVTALTWGGQAATLIGEIDSPNGTAAVETSLISAWYVKETQIGAMTSATISPTVNNGIGAAKPLLIFTGCFSGVNQTTPIVDSDAAFATAATGLTLPAVTTATGGTAVLFGHANGAGTWTSVGGGVSQKLIASEDASPDLYALVADGATTGVDVTASYLRSTTTRQTAFVVALASTAAPPPPSGQPVVTQTASRCALPESLAGPLSWRAAADNVPCSVVPGYGLLVVGKWDVTVDPEEDATAKTLQCCTSGGCDDHDDFWLVPGASDNFTTRPINFGTDSTSVALSANPFTTVTGTFVAGTVFGDGTLAPGPALLAGQSTAQGRVVRFSDALAVGTTAVCRFTEDDGSPFDFYSYLGVETRTQIVVLASDATGF